MLTLVPSADVLAPFPVCPEKCRRYLLRVANAEMPGHLRSKGGASDLVQDTLTKAYAARDGFRGTSLADYLAWLKTILRNELSTFRRRFKGRSRNVDREVSVPVACRATAARPDERLIEVERVAAITAAMAQLSEEDRRAIVLRFECQLGFSEIGARLGKSEDAARKHFTRALDRLRELTRGHAE